jgi:hypothetical protein
MIDGHSIGLTKCLLKRIPQIHVVMSAFGQHPALWRPHIEQTSQTVNMGDDVTVVEDGNIARDGATDDGQDAADLMGWRTQFS